MTLLSAARPRVRVLQASLVAHFSHRFFPESSTCGHRKPNFPFVCCGVTIVCSDVFLVFCYFFSFFSTCGGRKSAICRRVFRCTLLWQKCRLAAAASRKKGLKIEIPPELGQDHVARGSSGLKPFRCRAPSLGIKPFRRRAPRCPLKLCWKRSNDNVSPDWADVLLHFSFSHCLNLDFNVAPSPLFCPRHSPSPLVSSSFSCSSILSFSFFSIPPIPAVPFGSTVRSMDAADTAETAPVQGASVFPEVPRVGEEECANVSNTLF